jgi:hypothetical protein
MPVKWTPCDTPNGFEVAAYTCGKFVVACNRIRTGFAWRVFRNVPGWPEKFGQTLHQHVTPAALDDRDIRNAIEWAEKEIATHT